MRDDLSERRQRLLRRDEAAGADPSTPPDRVKTVVVRDAPRRPRARVEPSVPRLDDLEVPPTDRVKVPDLSPPPRSPKGAATATATAKLAKPSPRAGPPPEARWLEAAHKAWKSQVAELLRDKAEGDQQRRRLQAELDAALRAWKSQVAELLQRASEAEQKATERERWLESAHSAWKSQTAELLARGQGDNEQPSTAGADRDGKLIDEVATLRKQLYEEQLRHVDELDGLHNAYLKRAQKVDAAHFRIVEELRHEKSHALNRLGDALRLADRLNDRIQQMEAGLSPQAAPHEPGRTKRKGFVDAADGVPTVIGAPPPKPPGK